MYICLFPFLFVSVCDAKLKSGSNKKSVHLHHSVLFEVTLIKTNRFVKQVGCAFLILTLKDEQRKTVKHKALVQCLTDARRTNG